MRKSDPGFSVAALADVLFGELNLADSATLKIAYSGGLDSTVLLHALAALRPSRRFTLAAIHVDHGLHPDAATWAETCAATCRTLDVPFTVRRVAVTGIGAAGLEAAARRARYAALAGSLAPGAILLTAHQRDDQAETVLLQLLRGSGLPGLAAMPVRAPFGAGERVRPLLRFPRAALHAYAERNRLTWIEDPSNGDLRLRRNFLRAQVLPGLLRHWPAASVALSRAAAHAAEAMQLLDELAGNDLAACRGGDRRYPAALSTAALTALTPARQRNLLRAWLRMQGFLAPSARHLETILGQARHMPQTRQSCVRWPGVEIWRYRDLLVAVPGQLPPDPALAADWDLACPLELRGIGRLHTLASTTPDAPRIRMVGRLRVQLRRGGEILQLPGRRHHHALKKLIQAAGIPPWERGRLPLLYAGDQLVAVADRWVCAAYAAGRDEPGLQIVWEPFAVAEKGR